MQHQELPPPAALRDVIRCFWHNSVAAEELAAGFEVVPDGYAELIFCFGSACSVATPAGPLPLTSPFLVGLLQQPATFYAAGPLEILGVRCFPWTVFELLGLPAGQDGVRPLAHPVAGLQARLGELLRAGDLAAAVAYLAAYFEQARPAPAPLLAKAGAAMREAHGTLPVREVAEAAHATVRTLERRFKQSAGYTVKDVSALMRFEQVRNHLWHHPRTNLAGLAQELGYVDQAHLSREFKRFSGTTPAAFARQARRGPAGGGPNFVAFVQA